MKLNSLVGKIFAGFLAVSAIMCCAVLFNIASMEKIKKRSETINTVKFPALELTSNVMLKTESSLANLRGLLIIGNEDFETERRKNMAAAIQNLEEIQNLYPKLNDSAKADEVKEILSKINDLNKIQTKIYETYKSEENIPAKKLLDSSYLPHINSIFTDISAMIDEEKNNPGSSIRRQLFSKMADYRGYLTKAIAQLNSYLISQNPSEKEEFYLYRQKAFDALKWLSTHKSLFSRAQNERFAKIMASETACQFYKTDPGNIFTNTKNPESLSEIIFRFRDSDTWNQAQYILKTEAVPIANNIKSSLSELKNNIDTEARQSLISQKEEVESTVVLEKWLLAIAIVIAALISLYLRTAITRPIGKLVSAAESIAEGDLDQNVDIKGSAEIEQLSSSFAVMVENLKNASGMINRLGYGDFKFDVTPRGSKDELGKALNIMTESFREVTEAVRRVANGDFSAKVKVRGEKDELCKSINMMVKEIEQRTLAIKESEARNKGVVETAVDGIVSINSKGEILLFNPAAERLFGYSAAEVMGKNVKMLMPAPFSHEHDGYLKNHVKTGSSSIIGKGREVTGLRKDGSTFDIHLSLGKVDLEDEIVFVGIVRDITESKAKDKKLLENIAEFEKINDQKTQIAQASTAAQLSKDLNDLANNVTAYLAENFNLVYGAVYFKEDEREELVLGGGFACQNSDAFPPTVKAGEGFTGQCAIEKKRIVRKSIPADFLQVSKHGESEIYLITQPVCTTERLVAVISLLSFEELDEEQLKLLELICENLGVIIANFMSQKQTEKYLEEARKTGDQLQKQQEELKVTNEELEEQTEELRQSQEKLQLQSEELKAANEELEEKAELLEKQTLAVKKQNEAVENAKKDIEGKAQELALASKYKSEFLANMSHELRTPLNSLLILADSLIMNENGHLDEEEVESAKIIHNSGIELLDLINDILDLSKVEAGKMHLNLEQVSLKPMFENMSKQFKPLADQKGIDFLLDISDDCPVSILTDSQRVRQVIKNLVSNAMKFTKEGSVTIKVFLPGKETEFQTSLKHGASVGIAVEDTGIGIPEEKQEAIFEAFQQADGSTSRNYGGTGLGLAISREFSKLLGGEMQLYSKEGKGSCFTLFIPAEPNEVEKVPAEEKAAAKKTKTVNTKDDTQEIEAAIDIFPESSAGANPANNLVLIIEDDINFAQILKKEVVKREYEVLIAVNGAEGLKIANDLQPVAVLLDLGLPDMDGLQVLDQLKFNMRTKHIPVHIISGSEKEDQSLEKGAVGFLHKPASVKGINSALNKLESVFQKQIKKILVVEDDPGSQRALKTLISRDDVKIAGYELGNDALEAVEKEEFDCVILDLSLPDMDGFEFLELLNQKEMKHPPVVIYTGRDLSREEHKKLQGYTGSIIIKGKGSSERLLDEVALFLHSVNSDPSKKDSTNIPEANISLLEQKSVLLVDDDFRNTFALAKLLQRSHMNVTVAENGALALEELKKETFDIVLMDIMMPVMDGYEAMTKIRENEDWENLPIIALTAKAMPEDRSKCIEAGANDYLTKPVNKDELLSLMSLWLNK